MNITEGLKLVGTTLLLTALVWGVLAAPGFLSDRDSTVPLHHVAEVAP